MDDSFKSGAEGNRHKRRKTKADKRRHGMRGGSGKHSTLIQKIIMERAAQSKADGHDQSPSQTSTKRTSGSFFTHHM